MIVIDADELLIHVEPKFIAFDMVAPVAGITVRHGFTPDGARKAAAELLMCAERADRDVLDLPYEVVAWS